MAVFPSSPDLQPKTPATKEGSGPRSIPVRFGTDLKSQLSVVNFSVAGEKLSFAKGTPVSEEKIARDAYYPIRKFGEPMPEGSDAGTNQEKRREFLAGKEFPGVQGFVFLGEPASKYIPIVDVKAFQYQLSEVVDEFRQRVEHVGVEFNPYYQEFAKQLKACEEAQLEGKIPHVLFKNFDLDLAQSAVNDIVEKVVNADVWALDKAIKNRPEELVKRELPQEKELSPLGDLLRKTIKVAENPFAFAGLTEFAGGEEIQGAYSKIREELVRLTQEKSPSPIRSQFLTKMQEIVTNLELEAHTLQGYASNNDKYEVWGTVSPQAKTDKIRLLLARFAADKTDTSLGADAVSRYSTAKLKAPQPHPESGRFDAAKVIQDLVDGSENPFNSLGLHNFAPKDMIKKEKDRIEEALRPYAKFGPPESANRQMAEQFIKFSDEIAGLASHLTETASNPSLSERISKTTPEHHAVVIKEFSKVIEPRITSQSQTEAA